MDTTVGIAFRAWTVAGQRLDGTTIHDWRALPETGVLLVDVLEPKTTTAGIPYKWRMECEWFGCRFREDGGLEFQRWHEDTPPPCCTAWDWKQGQLVSDTMMQSIREEANGADV